jgi:hypothetical protein
MWALVENNQVTQVYTRPKAITIGDVSYPQNIFMLWSSDDLEAIGIYEVVVDNDNFKNPSYYINTNQSFDFANDVVTASYGTATAKPLDDVTDEDNNVTRGLKWNHKQVINAQAGGILQPTDWMVVRATEGGTAVPSDITTWRAAVRTKANEMCTTIDGAADVDALAALYEYNDAEPPVRPLGEFPSLDV